MLGNVEIRNLKEGTLYNVAQILSTNDDWKRFMSLIPKDLQNENSLPKYNNEHIRLIEDHSKATGENCAKILFDEWGTSGQVRPTLNILKKIAMKAEMIRVTEEIAKILGEAPPPRPKIGPAAEVDTNISALILSESSAELRTDEKSRNNRTTAQMRSDNSNGSNNKLPAQTTAQVKSESDLMKFPITVEAISNESDVQRNDTNKTVQGDNAELESVSDMIKFPKSTSSVETLQSEEWKPNMPAWSKLHVSPHTLNTKTYGHTVDTENSEVDSEYVPTPNGPPEPSASASNVYQQSLPNIELFQKDANDTENLTFSSRIDKSILQDTNLIHFNYIELKAITCDFSDTVVDGPYGPRGKIGHGGFGEVFLGSHPTLGPLAIKKTHQHVVLVHKPEIAVKLFNSEVKYLSQFRHENIVPILGFSKDGPALCIVCEYIEGGSLEQKIAERVMNEKQRINIMQGTADGLQYLHSYELDSKTSFTTSSDSSEHSFSKSNFVHRDVKSANILLTKNLVPKLCDFGLAKQYETTFITSLPMGTSAYMAPEGHYGTITQKIDIYSYGIVLLELLTGFKCFVYLENGDRLQIKHYIDETMKKYNKTITDFLDASAGTWTKSDELYKLACKCLKDDRQDRPAINEICEILRTINES